MNTLPEAYEVSRGSGIDQMFRNIREHPWTGVGFGIASNPSTMLIVRDQLIGLPLGAPVEKGVALFAVTEELGVVGAALTFIWIIALLRGAVRAGIEPFTVVLVILILNMGEYTLFSAGGAGLICMIVMTWAFTSGPKSIASAKRNLSNGYGRDE